MILGLIAFLLALFFAIIKPKVMKLFIAILAVSSGLILFEQKGQIPVHGASKNDWNEDSYWYEPWGASIVHRGIDIFGDKGQAILATNSCFVLLAREIKVGGNAIVCLDTALKLHYFAHLDSITTESYSFVSGGTKIGTLGDSGNAKGKQPHLHYSVMSVIPRPWNITGQTLGWMRMFYIDPNTLWD